MQIIGAGYARTGTSSLKTALEELGFGPCYHMAEVYQNPDHIKQWETAADQQYVSWQDFLKNYQSGVDYPLNLYYKELMQAFPEAKVVLTTRDAERWYDSTYEALYPLSGKPQWINRFIPNLGPGIKMVKANFWDGVFQGRFEDRQFAIKVFNDHNAEVEQTVPAEKLLVYSVKEGWEPLCEFLDVPVPDKPFPHVNDRKVLKRFMFVLQLLAWLIPLAFIALLTLIVLQFIG